MDVIISLKKLANNRALGAIGLKAAGKGFVIFLIYGAMTTLSIHFAYGLDADLPKSVISTLEGPISIYTFGWLSIVGLALMAIFTNLGRKECDLDRKKPRRVFCVALPLCEAALALGVVIGATLLGVALIAHPLYALGLTEARIFPAFYTLTVFMFMVTYPVMYFALLLIDSSRSLKTPLNFAAVLYIAASLCFLYVGLPIWDVIAIGILASVLMVVFYACQRWVFKEP